MVRNHQISRTIFGFSGSFKSKILKKINRLIFSFVILTMACHCNGQIIGKVFINKNEICSPCGSQDHFSFKPHTARLTKAGKEYLKNFAQIYKKGQLSTDQVVIIVESPVIDGKKLRSPLKPMRKRAIIVMKFLRNKFEIKATNAKLKLRETIRISCGTDGCSAIIGRVNE